MQSRQRAWGVGAAFACQSYSKSSIFQHLFMSHLSFTLPLSLWTLPDAQVNTQVWVLLQGSIRDDSAKHKVALSIAPLVSADQFNPLLITVCLIISHLQLIQTHSAESVDLKLQSAPHLMFVRRNMGMILCLKAKRSQFWYPAVEIFNICILLGIYSMFTITGALLARKCHIFYFIFTLTN